MGAETPKNTDPQNKIHSAREIMERRKRIRNLVRHILQNGSNDEIKRLLSLSTDPEVPEADRIVITQSIYRYKTH